MKLIITGASGMVGSALMTEALKNASVEQVIAIVRKPLSVVHPKLQTVLHQDFLNYSGLEDVFRNADACAWCLGVPQAWVTKEEYYTITYSYTLAAAKVMLAANPGITFLFVSGAGADTLEKSRVTFARVKGQTENALLKLPFRRLIIPRPGGIEPVVRPKRAPFSYKLLYPVYPLLRRIIPAHVITSVELAKAMLYLLINGNTEPILENRELKRLLKENKNI